MNYTETLEYLYRKLPMFSRMGSAAFKKDLINIRLLCNQLGDPQDKFKSIHVAGTNGKGSVSHMLSAILQISGYKTGLYTSPHLYDFRERIKINGEFVTEEFVIRFTEQVIPMIEEIEPSFFEITVAMAFTWFAEQKIDIAVVEVGLGGRLDSTNIITPELSVITNIGWDHMNILGNSLEEIAFEKAGIIKEQIPVVIGEKQNSTDPVFHQIANAKSAPIFFAEDRFSIENYNLYNNKLEIAIRDKQHTSIVHYELDLPGIYQTKNIITVLQALELVKESGITQEAVKKGLKSVRTLTGLKGRWEVIHENPVIVLEVAHNKEGIEQMLRHINYLPFRELHLILGTVKDKDVEKILELLPRKAHYYFTQAHIPRALDSIYLQSKAKEFNLKGKTYADVNSALQDALSFASSEDLIIVCGSIFLVAEVNKKLISQLA